MKKIITLTLSLLLIITTLAGCTKAGKKNDKLTVVTTVYPVYDFAKKIGGDKADIRCVIPQGTEPHDWEPTAADVVNLCSADVFVYNGAELEHWVNDISETLTGENVMMVCASENIEKIEADGHTDPHVWLDPVAAKSELEVIKNSFVEKDPENKEYYETNYETYKAEFEKLDSEYASALADCEQKTIITVHKAFAYLCNRYGLTQVTAEGAVAESEPEAKVLIEIADMAKQNNIKTIFVAEEGANKVADTLASEIGGEVKTLFNLENLTDMQSENGDDYLSVMRTNLETLKEVLK